MSDFWVSDGGAAMPVEKLGVSLGGARHPLSGLGATQAGPRLSIGPSTPPRGFVTRSGTRLLLDGNPYRFVGFNAFGVTGCESSGNWTSAQLNTYFGALKPNSMTRLWAFERWGTTVLDRVVAAAEAKGQKVCMTLNNDLNDCVLDSAKNATWYTTGYATGSFLGWVDSLVYRYRNSPAIGMWEVINEAGQSVGSTHTMDGTVMRNFYHTVGGRIKAIDPWRPVSTGDIAEFNYIDNTHFQTANSTPNIDVLSLHDYESDFIPSPPVISSHWAACKAIADTLNKPIMVGEINDSACAITKADRNTNVTASINSYFTNGAVGVLVWNFSQAYYNTCGTGGDDYIVVDSDPLATTIRNYSIA